MAQTQRTIRREGLSILKESQNDVADIVFVHGLNGHPYNTWTHKSASDLPFCWIAELPSSLDNLRAMTFGYDAGFHAGSENLMGVRQHAEALLLHLRNKRTGMLSRRPLVFVCHSLGGLVVKQALISSAKKSNYDAIHQSTRAIFFFGTPHRGARVLDSSKKVKLLEDLAKVADYEIPSNLRSVLAPRSNELFGINDDFSDIKGDITVVNFYEMKKTAKLASLVVETDSAIMHHPGEDNVPLMRTHQELVCYANADDDTYNVVVETLVEKLSHILEMQAVDEDEQLAASKFDCLKTLTFAESDRRITEISIPHERTFKWLWDEDTGLLSWMEQGSGIFWVTGKPGSGKSTLMKEIHSQLESECSKDTIVIPFFFNNRGTSLEKSVKGMLRLFVARILQQARDVQNTVLLAYRRKSLVLAGDDSEWEVNDLKKMLHSLLNPRHTSMRLVFVVDALDECEDASVMDLLTLFKELSTPRSTVIIKICVSSRQIPLGVQLGEKYPGLCLEDKTLKDISNYVEEKLMAFALQEEHDLLEDVKLDIIKKADGIFLWVELIMKQLQKDFEDGNTLNSYKMRLSHLPSELTELFTDILIKVKKEYQQQRNRLIGIVLCSRRPMTIAETRIAMALGNRMVFASHRQMETSADVVRDDTTMIKVIKSRCGGLIEAKKVSDTTTIVQFIHQSVKDFLVDKDKATDADIVGEGGLFLQGHTSLSKACVRYCILPELKPLSSRLRALRGPDLEDEIETISKKYPFLDYAINHWMDHCSKAEELGFAQTEELIKFRDVGADTFETWLELYNQYALGRSLADDTTLFLMAVMYDLKDLARKQLDQGIDVNIPVKQFGHYLQIAAIGGHEDMIRLLLDHGAEVNAVGGEYHTALQAAAYNGSKEAVEVLLDAGGDIGLRGGACGDPLSAAAYQGHEAIVDLLMERGAEVANHGGFSSDALRAAAETGRKSVVRNLLNHGADASAFDKYGVNILFWAIFSCSESTVNVFIENSPDITMRIPPGFTILHWVSLYGSEETISILLDKFADVAIHDFNGSTPLHWAASNLQPGALDILLDAGADPLVANNYGITPLHLAAGQAACPQVQKLLEAGAEVDACDLMGFTIFHYAALNRSADILGALLELDLDFSREDVAGRKPIHIAAEFGCLASLQLLAERTDDLWEPDFDGSTVLHAAARHESETLLQFCLEKRVDVSIRDYAAMTALHHVFVQPSSLPRLTYLPRAVEYLWQEIQRREKISAQKGRKNRTAKTDEWMAMELRDDERISATATTKITSLLEYGADIDAQDENGNTALHLASSTGNISAIKLLLAKGANPNLRDKRNVLPVDVSSCQEARDLFNIDF